MFLPESTTSGGLATRQYRSCGSNQYLGRDGICRSAGWYYWGRWVLAAVVIFLFIVLFVAWSCITNKRRRRAGLQPRYGTGWMAPGGWQHNQQGHPPQPQYNNGGWFGGYGAGHKNNNQPPPPQYTPGPAQYNNTGQTFTSNEGYYGHHQNDVPLQQPAGSYYPRAGENVYEPPAGPPPAKN